MKTVIMAGGKGTRIAELFPDIPKPLIPIEDENGISQPVLEWEIRGLVEQGFDDIVLKNVLWRTESPYSIALDAQDIIGYFFRQVNFVEG